MVCPADIDVVSEKHQPAQKKSLLKTSKAKFKSMVVTSQKLELTKRMTCSGHSDIFEPFGDKLKVKTANESIAKNKRTAKLFEKLANVIAEPKIPVN